MDKKKQEEIVSTVHKTLNIPDGYFRVPFVNRGAVNPEPKTDPLPEDTRRKAFHELCVAQIIDDPSMYPVLERMVSRIEHAMIERDRKKASERCRK